MVMQLPIDAFFHAYGAFGNETDLIRSVGIMPRWLAVVIRQSGELHACCRHCCNSRTSHMVEL
jgi:hypothetical protein